MAAKKLYRRRRSEGGILFGLCAGIGDHLGVDPVLVRLIFVVLMVSQVAGLALILIYVLFGLFVPVEPKTQN